MKNNEIIGQFEGVLEMYEDNLWNFHIKVPDEIINDLKKADVKRFLCQINQGEKFHTSLMPAGNDIYFIKINKELRVHHKLGLGASADIALFTDSSAYGMPLPEELGELFLHDPEGDFYFHQLTPGKQRSLLYIIGKPKTSDKRIEKSVIILDHLREFKGKLNYKMLNQDFKNKRGLL